MRTLIDKRAIIGTVFTSVVGKGERAKNTWGQAFFSFRLGPAFLKVRTSWWEAITDRGRSLPHVETGFESGELHVRVGLAPGEKTAVLIDHMKKTYLFSEREICQRFLKEHGYELNCYSPTLEERTAYLVNEERLVTMCVVDNVSR